MGRILSIDPDAARREIFHYSEAEEVATVETVQDVTDIVEEAKGLYNLHDERAPWTGDGFHKVASIPMNLYMELQAKGIADDPAAFKRWLNDPDNRVFRTRPGRV